MSSVLSKAIKVTPCSFFLTPCPFSSEKFDVYGSMVHIYMVYTCMYICSSQVVVYYYASFQV